MAVSVCWWTGPSEMTRFELYLGPERDWILTLRLHRATPPGHVQAARLSVNGVPLTLESATDEGGFLIKSGLERIGRGDLGRWRRHFRAALAGRTWPRRVQDAGGGYKSGNVAGDMSHLASRAGAWQDAA
jgi:hypothetical protein